MNIKQYVQTRAGKFKSLIRWKRRKGGKRWKKAEKADLVMQLAFWQKLCQKELQGPCSLYFTRKHQIQQQVRKVENV